MDNRRRVRGPVTAAGLALALAVLAGGCATIPTSGPLSPIKGAQRSAGAGQDYPQPIPQGPGKGWSPEQIVSGFLAASASFLNHHAVAREYLSPTAARNWHPGWAVTVVGNLHTTLITNVPRQAAGKATALARVQVTGQQLAALSNSGQQTSSFFSSSSPPRGHAYTFTLSKVSGQWRIQSVPLPNLLLTKPDFVNVYQPRNLYFFGPSGRVLVPDPVFVPHSGTNTDLARGLVNALRNSPAGWQVGATRTSFPEGTRVLSVRIDNTNATVNLGGAAARVSRQRLAAMAAQLVWTLTSPSYGAPVSQSVQIEVNGRGPIRINDSPVQLRRMYQRLLPGPSSDTGFFFVGKDHRVRWLSGLSLAGAGQTGGGAAVSGQAGTASVVPMSAIAVSPDLRTLAGIPVSGRGIYTAGLSHGGHLTRHAVPGRCTSLSWDSRGDIWAVTSQGIWTVAPGAKSPVQVGGVTLPAGDHVTALRVAPDGVRVVMIVSGRAGPAILLGAITRNLATSVIGNMIAIGSSITNPVALTWYNSDNVLVLSQPRSGAQLAEVPLNGGQPVLVPTEPDTLSITSNGTELVAGMSDGKLIASTTLGAVWGPTAAAGFAPVFPG